MVAYTALGAVSINPQPPLFKAQEYNLKLTMKIEDLLFKLFAFFGRTTIFLSCSAQNQWSNQDKQ